MNDNALEERLYKDFCNLDDKSQLSDGLYNRLIQLTPKSKHTKVHKKILTTKISLLLLLLFIIPTTAYASIRVSNALLEKVKDAGLNQKQIDDLYHKLRSEGFSEEDIANLDSMQKNRYGQTYGPDALEANLVKVISDEGFEGYVYREDLGYSPSFTTPEEAIKWQETKPQFILIPVYESDGKTIIGTFKIG